MSCFSKNRSSAWVLVCTAFIIGVLAHTFCLEAKASALAAQASDQESHPSTQKASPEKYVPAGPKYKVKVYRDVRAKMPDGVELAAVVVRPDAPGKFPAIMSYSPYRGLSEVKDHYSEENYNNQPDGPSYFAEYGYAVVYYDVRGTGDSGGSSPDMYADKERRDGYDMVEWIAAQPWCDGNVGMWGQSYAGVDQWQVGVQNPPHLKTLVVGMANTDVYLDWNDPGGVLRPFMLMTYSAQQFVGNFAPPDLAMTGEKWLDVWNEHLENNIPWGMGFVKNQLDGPYWQKKSLAPGYDRIKVPVMLYSGWADWYPTPVLRAFSNIKVPKKVYIGPWAHYWPGAAYPGPRIDFRPIMLSWYDHWLKGKDTGVMKTPPVVMFIRKYKEPSERDYDEDAGFWRYENEWPLARTQETPMYLHSNNELSAQPLTVGGDAHDQYVYKPGVGMTAGIHAGGGIPPWGYQLDQRLDEAYSLTYTTSPLQQDTEVTGNPQAILYISSSAKTAFFNVTLTDVAPDGTSKWVTHGELLASHRNSHAQPEALAPDKVYELKIAMMSMAYVFSAGHRIRVDVASANFQNAWPTAESAVNSIYHSSEYPSRIILPMAPPQNPKLATPELPPSPRHMQSPEEMQLSAPVHTITLNPVDQTVTMTEAVEGKWTQSTADSTRTRSERHSTFTVSDKNPSDASVRTTADLYVDLPGGKEIKIESNEVVMSDKDSFIYLPHVEVTVDGKERFSKSWTLQVPRNLN